jgi:hypothetical protein
MTRPCPTPITAYTGAAGNVTVPRSAVVPLLDCAAEWHDDCSPDDPACPSNVLRGALRDVLAAVADVVFVDSWPPNPAYAATRAAPRPAAHIHLRTDGRCVQRPGGELCGRVL